MSYKIRTSSLIVIEKYSMVARRGKGGGSVCIPLARCSLQSERHRRLESVVDEGRRRGCASGTTRTESVVPGRLPSSHCCDTTSLNDGQLVTRLWVQRRMHRPTGRRGIEAGATAVRCYPTSAGPHGCGWGSRETFRKVALAMSYRSLGGWVVG
jgi:hypothetical protein